MSLRERTLLALAAFGGTLTATWIYRGLTRDATALGLTGGLLSLLALVVIQFAMNLRNAAPRVREANTFHPGKPVRLLIQVNPGTRPLDQLQHDALYVAKKVEVYRGFRKILGCGEVNDRLADKALADLTGEIESFGARAHSLGPEVVSRRSRKEARVLYDRIQCPSHATDLDALVASIFEFTRPRPRGRLAGRRLAVHGAASQR